MAFNGEEFGRHIVAAVKDYLAREIADRDRLIADLQKRLTRLEREARNPRKGSGK